MGEEEHYNREGSYECKHCKEKFRLKMSLLIHEKQCIKRNNFGRRRIF